ncbi:MAG: histidine kinase [Bacteroidetes Order II. Incertae sedis bacterium]|nr:histidine kinase [Bacteroidetes Order II. bacterium]
MPFSEPLRTRHWTIRAAVHFLAWSLVLLMPLLFGLPIRLRDPVLFWSIQFAQVALMMSLYYGNLGIFLPRLLVHRKTLWYIVVVILVILSISEAYMMFRDWVTSTFGSPFEQPAPPPGSKHNHRPNNYSSSYRYFSIITQLVLVVFVGLTQHFIHEWQRSKQETEAREKERLAAELAFLRSQVSPHFLFNVLNGMVSLARKKSDKLEPALMTLSSLIRYTLYEAPESRVPLDREITYLNSYLDLQRLRFGDTLHLQVEISGDTTQATIEPLLLIPFVENAFKHGTNVAHPEIDLKIQVREEVLHFEVSNTMPESDVGPKDPASGIGLTNIRRRLDLLYPQAHSLGIVPGLNRFQVVLTVNLHHPERDLESPKSLPHDQLRHYA